MLHVYLWQMNLPKMSGSGSSRRWRNSGRWRADPSSLRKNRCIRPNCPVYRSGEGYSAYALHTRLQGRQTSLYVPDKLADHIQVAVHNCKKLQELLMEVGRHYVNALKFSVRGDERRTARSPFSVDRGTFLGMSMRSIDMGPEKTYKML
jgi:hypothetical protein